MKGDHLAVIEATPEPLIAAAMRAASMGELVTLGVQFQASMGAGRLAALDVRLDWWS